MSGIVVAVHRSSVHQFSKASVDAIELIPGHGVRDDAHFGATVQHLSRVAKDPAQPNLRQVHLLHGELFEELGARGIDLLGLSAGSLICIGATAVVRVTGLRNPCSQIDAFRRGLLRNVLERSADGTLVRRTGVMAVVEEGGWVRAGDALLVSPPAMHTPLQVV